MQKPFFSDFCYEEDKPLKTNVFVSIRNLFNGSYYSTDLFKNPERWVEAGMRIEFQPLQEILAGCGSGG